MAKIEQYNRIERIINPFKNQVATKKDQLLKQLLAEIAAPLTQDDALKKVANMLEAKYYRHTKQEYLFEQHIKDFSDDELQFIKNTSPFFQRQIPGNLAQLVKEIRDKGLDGQLLSHISNRGKMGVKHLIEGNTILKKVAPTKSVTESNKLINPELIDNTTDVENKSEADQSEEYQSEEDNVTPNINSEESLNRTETVRDQDGTLIQRRKHKGGKVVRISNYIPHLYIRRIRTTEFIEYYQSGFKSKSTEKTAQHRLVKEILYYDNPTNSKQSETIYFKDGATPLELTHYTEAGVVESQTRWDYYDTQYYITYQNGKKKEAITSKNGIKCQYLSYNPDGTQSQSIEYYSDGVKVKINTIHHSDGGMTVSHFDESGNKLRTTEYDAEWDITSDNMYEPNDGKATVEIDVGFESGDDMDKIDKYNRIERIINPFKNPVATQKEKSLKTLLAEIAAPLTQDNALKKVANMLEAKYYRHTKQDYLFEEHIKDFSAADLQFIKNTSPFFQRQIPGNLAKLVKEIRDKGLDGQLLNYISNRGKMGVQHLIEGNTILKKVAPTKSVTDSKNLIPGPSSEYSNKQVDRNQVVNPDNKNNAGNQDNASNNQVDPNKAGQGYIKEEDVDPNINSEEDRNRKEIVRDQHGNLNRQYFEGVRLVRIEYLNAKEQMLKIEYIEYYPNGRKHKLTETTADHILVKEILYYDKPTNRKHSETIYFKDGATEKKFTHYTAAEIPVFSTELDEHNNQTFTEYYILRPKKKTVYSWDPNLLKHMLSHCINYNDDHHNTICKSTRYHSHGVTFKTETIFHGGGRTESHFDERENKLRTTEYDAQGKITSDNRYEPNDGQATFEIDE